MEMNSQFERPNVLPVIRFQYGDLLRRDLNRAKAVAMRSWSTPVVHGGNQGANNATTADQPDRKFEAKFCHMNELQIAVVTELHSKSVIYGLNTRIDLHTQRPERGECSLSDFWLVIRNGGLVCKVSKYDLLPGDRLNLSKGDTVPANGVLDSGCSGLFVSEGGTVAAGGIFVVIDSPILTVETKPIVVAPENPVLVTGSKVLDGQCKMMVNKVGMIIQQERLMGNMGIAQVSRNRLRQNTIDYESLGPLVTAMGAGTNMYSHKTGTLTTNKRTVVESCICNHSDDSSLFGVFADLPEPVKILLQSISDDTGGEVVVGKSGKIEMLGKPMNTASLVFGLALGGNLQAQRAAPTIVKVGPFNSTKKRWRVMLLEQGGFRADTTAASEIILANYDKVINSITESVPLDGASVGPLQVTSNDFAGEGYMELDKKFSAGDPIPASENCIGIVGSTVPSGIKECVGIRHSVGINING